MAAVLSYSALSVRLLLLALLALTPTGAGADTVTWRKCKQRGTEGRIRTVPRDTQASKLDIRNCRITEIRPSDLSGLPNLQRIVLYENDITHINPVVYKSVPKLQVLAHAINKVREMPVFDEPAMCANLDRFGLRNNQVAEIRQASTFSGCLKLTWINIKGNGLNYIHPDVFKPLKELQTLYLHENRIEYIPPAMFVNNKKLKILWLHTNRISYLPLNFMTQLSNAGAGFDQLHFYNNPWHCVCLLELLADVKRTGVSDYERSKYSGAQPVCRYLDSHKCDEYRNRVIPSDLH